MSSFCSTHGEFAGMMPMWMFTLGQKLLKEGNITIPYVNLVGALLSLTIPLAVGLTLQRCKPTWAEFLR